MAFILVKASITAYYLAGAHHLAPVLPREELVILFWMSKIAPTLICASLVGWAAASGDRSLRFYQLLLIATVLYTIAVLYALHQGWRGITL